MDTSQTYRTRIIEGNKAEYGDRYAALKWATETEARRAAFGHRWIGAFRIQGYKALFGRPLSGVRYMHGWRMVLPVHQRKVQLPLLLLPHRAEGNQRAHDEHGALPLRR